MKTILIIFTLLAGISLSKVQGQSSKASPEEKKARRAIDSKAFSALNLTDDQKIKILPILITQNKALDSVGAITPSGNPQTAALALKYKKLDIEKAGDKKILSLLNDDQKKSYIIYTDDRTVKEFSQAVPQAAPPTDRASNAGGRGGGRGRGR